MLVAYFLQEMETPAFGWATTILKKYLSQHAEINAP